MKKAVFLFLFSVLYACAWEEKPIVVIIPSYCNAEWYERNLDSVCFQNYSNYRIIYVDDCSSDGTADLVQAYINKHGLQDKVTLVRNTRNRGVLYNYYVNVHQCADDNIIVILDGDDRLKHNDVLSRVNQEYQNQNVWLTYGQYETYPAGRVGICRSIRDVVIQKNAYRELDWVTSHLRTFYAGLFKQIELKDLIHEGDFFRVACDLASMFPMLEMSGGNFSFIQDVLYIYNEDTPLNNFRIRLLKQLSNNYTVRSRKKYEPQASFSEGKNDRSLQLIVFSESSKHLKSFLDQLRVHGWDEEVVVFVPHKNVASYGDIIATENLCLRIYEDDLDLLLEQQLEQSSYTLWTTDSVELINDLALDKSIDMLCMTKALSFNFSLSPCTPQSWQLKHKRKMVVPQCIDFPDNVYAWQFYGGEFEWREPFALVMTLFRSEDVRQLLTGIGYTCVQELTIALEKVNFGMGEVGLCYGVPSTHLH